MPYAQIEALRAAQDHVREASGLVSALAPGANRRAADAREDALEYLAAAAKRIEDAIKALAPPQKE